MSILQDYSEVIAAEASEVTRQETRVDTKAVQLVTLAGALCTLAAASATGLSALAPRGSGWLLLGVVPLLAAAGLWASAVVVLLRRVIRPRLAPVVPGSFACTDRLAALRSMSLTEYHESRATGLGGIVLARYRAVQRAADLLLAGFVPLILAVVAVAPVALLAVIR